MNRISIPTLLVFAVALAGCGQDSTTALAPAGGGEVSGLEQQTLEQNVAESPEVFQDGSYELPGEQEIAYESFGTAQTTTPDRPPLPRWFREIRERSRTVVVRIEEEADYYRAHARVTAKFAGALHIFFPAPDPSAGTSDGEHVLKRFADVAHRQAVYLKRKPVEEDGTSTESGTAADALSDEERVESEALAAHRHDWHLAGVSNARASSPDHTANILRIWLLTESGERYVVEDPLALMRFPRGLPAVKPGEVVKVVAKVRDPEDLLFLFTRWGRQVMVPVDGMPDMGVAAEPGLFAGRFRAPDDRRLFHVGVNALDRATLLTKDGRYDSDFWGLLLRNVRPDVATAE
jgi:hypothetical protein